MISGKKLHRAAILLLTGAVLLALARVNVRKSWAALAGIRWEWAASVALVNFFNTWIEACRWRSILGTVAKRARVRHAFDGLLVGVLGNVALPLRMGEGARAYFVSKKEGIGIGTAVSSVILDRLADAAGFVLLAIGAAALFAFPARLRDAGAALIGGFLLAGGFVVLLLDLERRRGSEGGSPLRRKIGRAVRRLGEMLAPLRRPERAAAIGFLTLFSWFLRGALIYLMFQAFGMRLPIVSALVVLVITNLGIALVNTPANVGGFELAVVGALKLFSVDYEQAIGFAIALHLVEVVPVALAGLVVLWISGLRLREFARPAIEEVLEREEAAAEAS